MITVNASRREPICLRHQGENDAMRVAFPLSAFEADWPGGTPLLLVQRPRSSMDAEAYPVALSVDGHTAYWTVSASDVEYSGYGKAQLQWRVEDVLVKSCIYDTVCVPSLHAGAEPPDAPSKRWFDAIQAQIGDLSNLTTKAKDNLVAAINEAARAGGGSGGAGTIDMRVADGYIQYSNDDGATWENLIAIAELKGADGDGANVTKDAVVGALGFTPISADDVPVNKVNGATGEVKSTFYVTVTPTGSGYAATADKTAAEVYAAYEAGYAVYAIVKFASVAAPFELPLVAAASALGTILLGFSALGSTTPTGSPLYPTVAYTGTAWMAWLGTLAKSTDIPTALKNPNALNIKIGDTTTIYDGSAEKTVEIPEGGGTDESLGITGAAAGKIPKIKAVDAAGKPTAWEAAEMPASGPTDAQVSSAVSSWLTEHPEATTTVQDGAITTEKLANQSVSTDKLAGYSTECRDIPWTLFLDGYGTTGGVKAENANCAIYSVKFEAGKTYCLTQLPYPVNTNEFVTDPSDIATFGWYHAYPSLPDAAEALENGRVAAGIINTIMKTMVTKGYIEPAISGQTLGPLPAYFTVKQDWYLLRASVKPDAGKRINNCFVAEVQAGMSDLGNGMHGQSWYVFKKDLGNGFARDEGYLQQIFVSKTANAENERAYAAMSRDVPRDRTLSIQFIGDSITYAASNAGLQNAFRKYVPMNLRAETMALCQSGASVTTGSGSFDWNGKQNTDAAYDAAMSGYSGLAQKLAEYKTNLSLKMWADAVDIVVVELGTNDHWEQAALGAATDLTEDTNFYGAVEKTLALLEETFPSAQILWLLPFKNQKWKTSTVKMVDYLIALKILCQMHTRCWVLDLFDKWFLDYDDTDLRSKFFRDGVHITGDAHKCVAESMIDKIRQIISVCGLRQIETVHVTDANDSVYGSAT